MLAPWMTHETNYFIKEEEAHDHKKVTKLVMSLQSSEIKLAGGYVTKGVNIKKIIINANRVTNDLENISRAAKDINIL